MRTVPIAILAITLLGGCVHQQDLDAWVGQPVSALDKQPFFLTLPMQKTITADGTEIRNYVNGRNIGSCYSGGNVYGATVNYTSFNAFTNCSQSFAACNNLFYIKNGIVERYAPTGSGGARCMTDSRVRP